MWAQLWCYSGTTVLIVLGIFTTASTNLIYATNFMALIALYKTDLVVQPWMTFVVYEVSNVLTAVPIMFGNRSLPLITHHFTSDRDSGLIMYSVLPSDCLARYFGYSGCNGSFA